MTRPPARVGDGDPPGPEVVPFDVDDPLARAALAAYVDELADRLGPGFDLRQASRPLSVDQFSSPDGAFVAALDAGRVIACGGARRIEPGVVEIKRMWVDASWRGRGLGRELLGTLERAASELGATTVRLDTNTALAEALGMYRSLGYVAIERYNENPDAELFFEKKLGEPAAQ